jgi:hypothetical protein
MVQLAKRYHEDVWRSGSIAPPLLASALDKSEWSVSHPIHSTLCKESPLHCTTSNAVQIAASVPEIMDIPLYSNLLTVFLTLHYLLN